MKIKKKNLVIIIILSLFMLAVAMALLLKLRQIEPASETISLAEAIEELDYSYKLLEFPFPEIRSESAGFKIARAYEAWEVFINAFFNIQPPEFGKTNKWQKKMIAIREYSRKANELAQENNEGAARLQMEKAYGIFAQIKKENNIRDMFTEISSFYGTGRKVGLARSKEEAVTGTGLTDLKLIFTGLKERVVDNEYRRLMAKLEQAILDIERLLPGPDFKKAQSDLISGAEEMYWKY